MMRKRLTREERKTLTRERLLDAAREAFVAGGFSATSVERIAEVARHDAAVRLALQEIEQQTVERFAGYFGTVVVSGRGPLPTNTAALASLEFREAFRLLRPDDSTQWSGEEIMGDVLSHFLLRDRTVESFDGSGMDDSL